MSELIEKLKQNGCNMNETLNRFLGDEEFYKDCFVQMMEDSNYELLGEALKNHDVKGAFDHAHTIKGLAANMGLTSLLDIVVKIVEPLRKGSDEGLEPVYEEMMKEKQKYEDMLKD